jgi:hypothetical protein
LAANFKTITKACQEDAVESGSAKLGVTFTFEIDQTSPLVAAITKLGMGFSVKHGTKGKAQTFDLTQGELPLDGEDMSEVLDTRSLAKEAEESAAPATTELPTPGGDEPPPSVDTAEEKPKKKGRGKK